MELSKVPTNQLVEELCKRQGVTVVEVEPHAPYTVEVPMEDTYIEEDGPAIILIVED